MATAAAAPRRVPGHGDRVVTMPTFREQIDARLEVVEGLLIGYEQRGVVVELVAGASDEASAQQALRDRFRLSAEQARALVQMRFGRLTASSIDRLRQEQADLRRALGERPDG